ncbi:MAG: dienelactone hydrolase family protein, partial [Myxococcota bacterium]
MARGRAGSDIDLDAGASASKLPAYHAVPAAGRGRGVLVLGETGALDDFARDVCDRLARAGFAALAPDAGGAGAGRAAIEAGVRALLDDDATDGPRLGGLGFAQGGVRLLAAAAARSEEH